MQKIHTLLVTAYLIGGLALMISTPWTALRGDIVNSGGAVLDVQGMTTETTLHGSADASMQLAQEAVAAAKSAAASRQLMLGVLLFTLGGFLHAYHTVRSERPVHITVKPKKREMLYLLEMRI